VIGNKCHLVPRTVARGVGLPQAFRDGARHLQDIIDRMRVLGDPRDGWQALIHQDLRDAPHQDCQSPGLGDALYLGLLEVPPKLDELHQLFTVVKRVEALGLCLHQRWLTQV
jgi:hypothetical protein